MLIVASHLGDFFGVGGVEHYASKNVPVAEANRAHPVGGRQN